MADMQRLEEVWSRGQFLSCPDVPARGVALGRVTETVNRPHAVLDVSSDSDFEIGGRRVRLRSEAFAHEELRWRWPVLAQHPKKSLLVRRQHLSWPPRRREQ